MSRILLRSYLMFLLTIIASGSALALSYTTRYLGQWEAYKINNLGRVIGYTQNGDSYSSMVWDPVNGLSALGLSLATVGINDNGQIVGWRWFDGACHSYLVDNGKPEQEIGQMWVGDVNNHGTAISTAFVNDYGLHHLFLWNSGNMVRDDYVYWTAMGINDQNEAVGYTNWNTALLWDSSNGGREVAPFMAMDINNRDQIVGCAQVNGWWRPYIWDPINGLQSIMPPSDMPSNKNCIAYGINDSGVIVGQVIGEFGSREQSVMWTPVPELPSAVPLLVGFLLLGMYLRRPSGFFCRARSSSLSTK